MSKLDFHFEFNSDIPQVNEAMIAAAEARLRTLAENQSDMIGASVAVEELTGEETPHAYRARAVAYIRPENVAAVEKDDGLELALEKALDALERQILARREKFRKPWEQPDRGVDTSLYELTARELYDAYADQADPAALAALDRDKIAARLMVDQNLDQEAAYYAADQILVFAEEATTPLQQPEETNK